MGEPKIKFSVITATYNAAEVLPRLISSLQTQTDQDFEWVVADGASTDETLVLLEKAKETLNIRMDSRPDFGIYDALNRAVKMAHGDYYLVLGADDEIFPETIKKYKNICSAMRPGMVTARVEVDGRSYGIRSRPWEWLYGQFAHVSAHAVGLVIRRDLHDRFGWYSRKFPIAADQLFILKAIHGEVSVCTGDFVAGRFSTQGTSGVDILGALVEGFRVQVMVGHNICLQLALLVLRVLKNIKTIKLD